MIVRVARIGLLVVSLSGRSGAIAGMTRSR
jgi:hypothetical protein